MPAIRPGGIYRRFKLACPWLPSSRFRPIGYGERVRAGRDEGDMQAAVNTNIEHVFLRLGRS
jgi:hypothetical protein